MSGLYNSSSHVYASLSHSPLFRRFTEEAEFVLLLQISIVLGVFYVCGHLLRSPDLAKSTILLSVVTFILNPRCARQVIHLAYSSSRSTGTYLICTVLLQIGLAAKFTASKQEPQSSTVQLNHRLKPRLFPCRTTHTRLFPTKHSFSYSYLLVGVPVSWQGTAGSLLSVGKSFSHQSWFTVDADDYLARGSHPNGLQGKLDDYLSSQNIPANQYASAYLVTAPRFLGFSFNPVSFWYLYGQLGQLSAMILEVNNTFDERRMYFMERDKTKSTASTKPFSTSWSKDFHVSPFNDREGAYSLTAKDVEAESSESSVDNNIILSSDEGKAKIIARICSTENGLDPGDMSRFLSLSFLRQWWWVGFMTNPRILREARLLWVKGLQVFYRPEVLRTSIGRNETSEESSIEPYFRAFLTGIASAQDESTVISYIPAAGPDRGKTLKLNYVVSQDLDHSCRIIDIHILTPAFYSECVLAIAMSDVFSKCCFRAGTGEAMVHLSDPVLFQSLLTKFTPVKTGSTRFSRREKYTFCARRSGTLVSFLCDSLQLLFRGRLRHELWPSELDCFIETRYSQMEYRIYVRVALRILLANRLAFGFGWILGFYKHLLDLTVMWRVSLAATQPWLQTLDKSMILSLFAYVAIYHTIQVL